LSLIDLHTHTTASDGRHAPDDLVDRAVRAGVRVLAVTDHDTVAGVADARRHAEASGLEFVTGIEITAMAEGADVHVLGYFVDVDSPALLGFLKSQREARIRRVRQMIDRLRAGRRRHSAAGTGRLEQSCRPSVDCARARGTRSCA
jgi:predicted metal-dependent phosphoesterase TrpH